MSKMSALKEQVREMVEDSNPRIATTKSNPGICTTCRNESGCFHRKNAKVEIFHCEEFDSGLPETTAKPNIEVVGVQESVEVAQLKGLCRNCAKNANCMFPKTEGGIWHCEEYE